MDDFLKKVIEGNGITPPQCCLNAFNENFEGAVNIEWFDKKTQFEAIFYKNNIEHIAVFSPLGDLAEYKMFLPENYLPEPIKNVLENKGEIMNLVLINKGNSIYYEAILRDKELNRFLFFLTDMGKIIETKPL